MEIIVKLLIFCIVLFNIIFLYGVFDKTMKCDITSRFWLGIKNKMLWKILFQYIILLPTMLLGWFIVLMRVTPFKSKKVK